ncbi:MAG TPA: Na+/H+ antiporter NhaC family protein, partial [Phycisphaerae bacterium]|nr:Na+/H+ antiporter NhaC family protein [Phycisphaerae bacterium]
LADVEPYSAFLSSIPYRFYVILALVMVFLIGLLQRDFGPMRKAERAGPPAAPTRANNKRPHLEGRGRVWYAGVPVLVLVGLTIGLLGATGWVKVQAESIQAQATIAGLIDSREPIPRDLDEKANIPSGFKLIQSVVSKSEPYNSILYGALAAIVVALVISLGTRALTLGNCVESATESMARMFPTMVVLVLAWTLSASMEALQLGQVAQGLLQAARFDPTWLPLLVFVSACVVSFATGTSWGTMGILCPATVTIAAGLLADHPADDALPLFYASVGAVLAGAVFGDHCSPISDTTVLSSLASECSLEDHVWTQLPYALTVAVVSIVCGDILCRQFDQPAWVGLLAGTAALILIVLIVGRKPTRAAEPAPNTTG